MDHNGHSDFSSSIHNRIQKNYLEYFDRQRKQGFSIPLSSWLKGGPFREFFNDVLLDQNCIFNHSMVKRLLNSQDRGLKNSERLFGLVIFELWRREYNISL